MNAYVYFLPATLFYGCYITAYMIHWWCFWRIVYYIIISGGDLVIIYYAYWYKWIFLRLGSIMCIIKRHIDSPTCSIYMLDIWKGHLQVLDISRIDQYSGQDILRLYKNRSLGALDFYLTFVIDIMYVYVNYYESRSDFAYLFILKYIVAFFLVRAYTLVKMYIFITRQKTFW